MVDKISYNVGMAILGGLALAYKVWSNYHYSIPYTMSNWVFIMYFILIITVSCFKQYENKTKQ